MPRTESAPLSVETKKGESPRNSQSPASTISEIDSPQKKAPKKAMDDPKDQMDDAERTLAMKMKLISEMSERVEQRPPRITRTTIMPEFDQIPDETGELRYKADQWAAKASYLLTSLFLHEAAIEACAIESRYELAKTPGLGELEAIFAKIKAYQVPTMMAKPGGETSKEAAATSEEK